MISTGLQGLDEVLTGLRVGDNVVWQIDDIADYKELVGHFVKAALKEKKKVIYMRFAPHEPLLQSSKGVKTYELNADAGFEAFSTRVNNIITEEGEGAYYVFDCLSALLSAWATDLMIGNFFMVTCPYLYELNTVTYFSLLRNNHSFKAVARIRETTQLLIDVYRVEGGYYIHPLKVWNRYSQTMFLPHVRKKDDFLPITDSVNAANLFSYIIQRNADAAKRNLDYWDRLFLEAEELLSSGAAKAIIQKMIKKLCSIMITRDRKMLPLAEQNFSLREILDIKSRLIGTGFVGGKSVGMLLARKMLSKDKSLNWEAFAEPHDSFYIGSDIYYSYIVQNRWWKLRMQQKTDEGYFSTAAVLREKMLFGTFPEEVMEQFEQIIEYFGSSPFIVRSSSLLEDSYGNAFAGKYLSVFCPNQGTPEQRYLQFVDAVKRIYASAMSEDALAYRKQRGLDRMDEQMALLVQRVSGSYHKHYFFPDIAGVGFSYNTYVWNREIDPKAGMLRIVMGLGTRAVNRVEGDYPRVVALDEPLRQPYNKMEDVRRFSQHDIDLINVKSNLFEAVEFSKLIDEKPDLTADELVERGIIDLQTIRLTDQKDAEYSVVTFDKLLSGSAIVGYFKKILKSLEDRYSYPVEIEFTINFTDKNEFKINLLQCRPLQTKGIGPTVAIPAELNKNKILFKSEGYFLGGNISQSISRIIYVSPEKYHDLTPAKKYEVARIVGSLNRQIGNRNELPTLLLGPGRWGTTTPSLGVPVTFAEINNVAVLAEISFEGGNLMPEVSFGTHFFQDLVETDIFYLALFPDKKDVIFNVKKLSSYGNILGDLLPERAAYKDLISVYDVSEGKVKVMSDILSQQIICLSER